MRKRMLYSISFLAAIVAISGCAKEEIKEEISRYVTFSVTTEESIDTKSTVGSTVSESDLSEGDCALFVTSSVSRNDSNPFNVVETKGKTIESVPLGFSIDMVNSGAALYKSGVTGESGVGNYWSMYVSGEKVLWPEGAGTYDFYAYYGSDSYKATYGASSSISYIGPTPGNEGTDAASAEDFLIGCTMGVAHDHANQNLVKMKFFHTLAAVRFKVAPEVQKITISNIAKDGTVICHDVDPTNKDAFKNIFSWTPGTKKCTYSQTFSSNVDDMTFFIVPQNLDGVTLTFEIEKDGKVHQITTRASAVTTGTTSWAAGYIYNYTVDTSTSGNVGIKVSEEFLSNVSTKNHVGSKTVTRSTVYVRALVVGNWCLNNSHVVYAPWSDSSVTYEVGENAPWFKNKDGYFYLKDPLVGYTTSEDLIKSYVEKNTARPSSNLHLELHVLTQAVEWDKEKKNASAAWGAEVAAKLK